MERQTNDGTLTRYLRLVVHAHPLRAREYIEGLKAHGWSRDEIARRILLPARRRILAMRAARKLNAADTGIALHAIRTALAPV